MKAFGFAGLRALLVLFVLLAGVCAADAFNLPISTVKGVVSPGKGRALQGCPKLVARELHIVRVIPQRTRRGDRAYRYILNGTIQNRGLAGVAVVGINVTQKKGRGATRRIALKLLKRRVQPNQRLDVSGDLHLQVQSNPILLTDNPFPIFTLNVTNLRNDSGQCADTRGTAVHISSNTVRRALPARVRGVSQPAGSLTNAKKTLNWQQPVPAPSKTPPVRSRRGTAKVTPPSSSVAATKVRRIGEDAARAKQIQQMQKARDLGSPMEQARRGPTGRQDCRKSSDPAGCLQSNLSSPNQQGQFGPGRGSMQECLQRGGKPADCMGGGIRGGSGYLSSGPAGDPRSRLKDPRSLSSTQFSGSSSEPTGKRVEWGAYHETESHDGITGKYRQGTDLSGNVYMESVQYNQETESTIRTTSIWNKETDAATFHRVETDASGHVTEDVTTRVHPQNEQGAPDGSSGMANDNCDWNPALSKCMKAKPDPKGMTSQPGPDGENPGSQPGSATPQIGSEAVTNGGGGDWNTSGRRGFGFGHGGKPLDMKDLGGVAPK